MFLGRHQSTFCFSLFSGTMTSMACFVVILNDFFVIESMCEMLHTGAWRTQRTLMEKLIPVWLMTPQKLFSGVPCQRVSSLQLCFSAYITGGSTGGFLSLLNFISCLNLLSLLLPLRKECFNSVEITAQQGVSNT